MAAPPDPSSEKKWTAFRPRESGAGAPPEPTGKAGKAQKGTARFCSLTGVAAPPGGTGTGPVGEFNLR